MSSSVNVPLVENEETKDADEYRPAEAKELDRQRPGSGDVDVDVAGKRS